MNHIDTYKKLKKDGLSTMSAIKQIIDSLDEDAHWVDIMNDLLRYVRENEK
jgi:hypothetical protein